LVFTDLVDSTALKTRIGDRKGLELIARHAERVRRLVRETQGREVDEAGDGFFLTFATPSAAVSFALRLQQIHHDEPGLPKVRVGVHLGEVSVQPAPAGSTKPDRAISISPRDPDAYGFLLSMSWAHFAAERYTEAVEWPRRAFSCARMREPIRLQRRATHIWSGCALPRRP
jgi:hypothetical protein